MRAAVRSGRHWLALWMLCGLAAPAPAAAAGGAQAAAPAPGAAGKLFDFDIPAQPLAAALQRYGSLTRQPALFRSEVVDGQVSSTVRGLYAPEAALRLLLDGTGLAAEKFDIGAGSAFVLKAVAVTASAEAAATAAAAAPVASLGNLAGYPSQVQARVWQALCDNPRTVPGEYRSLLRFQVDNAGQVRRARLIGSTGNARRDAALLETLQRVRMDSAPPPDMSQPVTMLLLPHDAGFALRCGHDIDSGAP